MMLKTWYTPPKLSYIIALLCSASIMMLYVLSIFNTFRFPAYLYRLISLNIMKMLFYLMLSLIVVKEVVSSYYKDTHYITISLIVVSAIYSFISALREISHLTPGYFVIIPPSFIYSRCDIAINCNDFASLSISIPLTIAFVLLIYSLHGIVVTVTARNTK